LSSFEDKISNSWKKTRLCVVLILFVRRFDTQATGNWYKADEPWGAFLQTDGNPAVTVHPYENDPSSGSFNPQAQTTWVPTDWGSWPNYNVHGYGIY
jgi:hypothetical protein